MESAIYRPDYAKFVLDCEPDYFQQCYHALCAWGRDVAQYGDFLREHRVSVFPGEHPQLRRYVIELWGESTAIVFDLNWPLWSPWLKRFDVRCEEPELAPEHIMELGQLLQQSCTKYNINTYRTRPASKRSGRDRGGVGYAIGSHKSQLRVTTYKRAQESAATETQCTGVLLKRAVEMAASTVGAERLRYADPWVSLVDHLRSFGERRIEAAWKAYAKQLRLGIDDGIVIRGSTETTE